MKTSAIALTFLVSQYTIVDGQLANAPIKRTRALSSTTDNIISASSSSKQQQRINTARLLKAKRRRDNKAQRLLEDDASMSLATTDSMSMSVSLEPDVKDMFAATDSGEKGVESVGTFGDFEGILTPTKSFDPKAEKVAKAEKHSKATKLFRRKLDAREEQQVPIKRRVSPADRFLQEEGSMSLATETSMSFLIEPEVKDMFAAAGGDVEATTVDFVEPLKPMFSKASKVYKTKTSKTSSTKAEKVADAKAEKVVGDAKSSKVYSEKTVDRRHRRRRL